jgi:hypothetical protein
MPTPLTYTIPETAVERLAQLGEAMLMLAREIKAHQTSGQVAIPIPDLTPPSLVSPDDADFWSPDWQAKEQAVNEGLVRGEYVLFNSVDDLLSDLHKAV